MSTDKDSSKINIGKKYTSFDRITKTVLMFYAFVCDDIEANMMPAFCRETSINSVSFKRISERLANLGYLIQSVGYSRFILAPRATSRDSMS